MKYENLDNLPVKKQGFLFTLLFVVGINLAVVSNFLFAEEVTHRPGTVEQNGIVSNSDGDISIALEFIETAETIYMKTKPFTPPAGWIFLPFDDNPNLPFFAHYVDLQLDPLTPIALVMPDSETVVQIAVTFTKEEGKESSPFPIRAEGNMSPTEGGEGPAVIERWTVFVKEKEGDGVDIVIHNGLGGATGGQAIGDPVEDTTGAVTVVNTNDTNGNGKPDTDDKSVKKGKTGRDEVDLMKLIIKSASPADNTAEVVLTLTGTNKNVTFWTSSTKEKQIKLKDLKFKSKDLPQEVWVETTKRSDKIADIKILATYKGSTDVVVATSMEVVKVSTITDPKAKIPGELAKTPLEKFIKALSGKDGKFFGHGPFFKKDGTNDHFYGGRILFKFKILPVDVETTYKMIKFDVTRQAKYRYYKILLGKGKFEKLTQGVDKDDLPKKDEVVNDDTDDIDEHNIPTKSHHLFSYDGVSESIPANKLTAFKTFRFSALEWVRVRFDGKAFEHKDKKNKPVTKEQGSRASAKVDWHVTTYLIRSVTDKLIKDNATISWAFPINRFGNADPKITTSTLTNTDTAGLLISYDKNKDDLQLDYRPAKGAAKKANAGRNADGKTFDLLIKDTVKVVVVEKLLAFTGKDLWEYSIFKTKQKKKVSEVAEKGIDVTLDP